MISSPNGHGRSDSMSTGDKRQIESSGNLSGGWNSGATMLVDPQTYLDENIQENFPAKRAFPTAFPKQSFLPNNISYNERQDRANVDPDV